MSIYSKTMMVVVAMVLLSACIPQSDQYQVTYDSESGVGLEEKQGATTVRGKVVGAGGSFYLLLDDSSRIELDSYAITLQDYVGQQVSVTGQYSGDTLFVGSVE